MTRQTTKTIKENKKNKKNARSVVKARRSSTRRPAKVIKDKLEDDNVYILKLVLYLVLGAQWVHLTKGAVSLPIPFGIILGIILVRKEQLPTDRKIGYAILLVSMFIAFWLPIGLTVVV